MSRKVSRKSDRQRRAEKKKRLALESLEQKVLLTTYSFAEAGIEWAYTFEGDAAAGDDAASLDGTWSHDNGSDAWDGSEIGGEGGNPGGVSALTDGDTDYIRVQDPGDPRDALGVEDPSNRKVYFTHALSQDAVSEDVDLSTIVDDGVTLYFRARVATSASGPIDDLHADGGTEAEPWPEDGLGYYQHNGGKSMIAIKQVDGPNIALGLDRGGAVNEDLFADADGNAQEGLILPHLLQDTATSDSSDPGEAPETLSIQGDTEGGNIVAVDDVTEWQEFWVTIQAGQTTVDGFDDGTHIVRVFSANAENPLGASQFGITAATGSDGSESYIAIGAGGTPRAGAFDVDFFSWTPGVHNPAILLPGPEENPDVGVAYQGVWDYAYDGSQDSNDSVGALDGAWDHTENDRWDGSGPGEEGTAPGGIKSFTEGDVTYLRVQDAGDPRGLGFDDAVSNRKMSLNRDVAGDEINRETFLDDGFTFSFRARLATDGPLDQVTFGGEGDQEPWPENGRGSDIDFGGTGFITLSQQAGNAFSFALADLDVGLQDVPEDLKPETGGLIMNNLAGDVPSAAVNTQDIDGVTAELNLLPIEDLTDWTEFWINIVADTSGGGTHKVDIYTNGSTEADTFHITTSSANRFEEFCICPSFTSGAVAVDIDYMAYAAGVLEPTLRGDTPEPGGPAIDLSGGTSAQSSQLGGFVPENALDDVANFTHTLAGDENPTWQVQLEDFYAFDSVTVFNRGASEGTLSCCPSRLRDITIQIINFDGDVNTDFTGGTIVASSDLLNPENEIGGGTNADGPISLSTSPGGAVGNLIRVIRSPDDDLSGSGGEGNDDEGSVLSIDLVTATGTMSVAPLSDVTSPGDALVRVDGQNDGDDNDGPPPAGEIIEHVIDDVTQKHLNFLDLGSGFIVTPSAGLTNVTGLRLFSANDAIPRDPASYVLEGGSGDGTFTLISEGDLALPDARNAGGDIPITLDLAHQEISFENEAAYAEYRLTFPTLKDAEAANSMQIAEVEFLGTVTEPAGLPTDINGNGEVDFADFLELANTFGETVDPPGSGADINGNGEVDFADFLALANDFGKTAAAVDAVFAA